MFFKKPNFPDNLKKYKTKTIPKNSILFKPKYDFNSRTEMLLFGIVFVLYCCFVQCIPLESGPIKTLFKFPDLSFSFQFSYRFYIFRYTIFDFFLQFLCSFKLQLLFHVKTCLLVGRKKVLCIFYLNKHRE